MTGHHLGRVKTAEAQSQSTGMERLGARDPAPLPPTPHSPAEEWRRQIHVYLRQARVPLNFQSLGSRVPRPAGTNVNVKLGQVLKGDPRFVLEGSGHSITARSSDDAPLHVVPPQEGPAPLPPKSDTTSTAFAFSVLLSTDPALRARCRDRAVFEEEFREWKSRVDPQGVKYTGSASGILAQLRRLKHVLPAGRTNALVFAGDAKKVVKEVQKSSSRRDTETDREGIVILPREVPLPTKPYTLNPKLHSTFRMASPRHYFSRRKTLSQGGSQAVDSASQTHTPRLHHPPSALPGAFFRERDQGLISGTGTSHFSVTRSLCSLREHGESPFPLLAHVPYQGPMFPTKKLRKRVPRS